MYVHHFRYLRIISRIGSISRGSQDNSQVAVLCIGDFTLAASDEMSGDISSIKGGSSDAIN